MKKIYWNYVQWMSWENDKYWFVDENQVRIESWFALFFALYAFISIVFFAYYAVPTIVIWILWFDFIFKIFVKPKSLFFWKISKIILKKYSNKKPYFVWALQKKFAWKVWLFLSTFAFLCILIVSWFLAKYWIAVEPYEMSKMMAKIPWTAVPFTPPLIACIICIIFMTLESVFWYCVGCKIYVFLVKKWIMKKVEWQICANWVCEIIR